MEYHQKIIRENCIFIPDQFYARTCQYGMAEELTMIIIDVKAKLTAMIRGTFLSKQQGGDDGIHSPPHHIKSFYQTDCK
jgi:hypothetical protein